MRSFLIALALAFSVPAFAQPTKQPAGVVKKEVKKPEVKAPTKVKKAPAAVQKKAAENNAAK